MLCSQYYVGWTDCKQLSNQLFQQISFEVSEVVNGVCVKPTNQLELVAWIAQFEFVIFFSNVKIHCDNEI